LIITSGMARPSWRRASVKLTLAGGRDVRHCMAGNRSPRIEDKREGSLGSCLDSSHAHVLKSHGAQPN
jgi:hypothetical protein